MIPLRVAWFLDELVMLRSVSLKKYCTNSYFIKHLSYLWIHNLQNLTNTVKSVARAEWNFSLQSSFLIHDPSYSFLCILSLSYSLFISSDYQAFPVFVLLILFNGFVDLFSFRFLSSYRVLILSTEVVMLATRTVLLQPAKTYTLDSCINYTVSYLVELMHRSMR